MVLIGLTGTNMSVKGGRGASSRSTSLGSCHSNIDDETHKWKAAIVARDYLWYVNVDKYLGMTQRSSATIASHQSILGPSHGLFMDQLDCSVGLGLWQGQQAHRDNPEHVAHQERRTWYSMIICSNRGPVMALLLSC